MFHDSNPQTMVTIHVKNENATKEQSFIVHKEFICYYSPFFDAAFNGSFIEGASQALDLEDVEPAIFALLVGWIYSQTVPPQDAYIPRSALCALWVLADRLLIPKLQNEVIVALDIASTHFTSARPTGAASTWVYQKTTSRSPLRRYLTHLVAAAPPNSKEPKLELYPTELLIDVIRFMRENDFKSISCAKFTEEQLKQFFVKEDSESREEVGT